METCRSCYDLPAGVTSARPCVHCAPCSFVTPCPPALTSSPASCPLCPAHELRQLLQCCVCLPVEPLVSSVSTVPSACFNNFRATCPPALTYNSVCVRRAPRMSASLSPPCLYCWLPSRGSLPPGWRPGRLLCLHLALWCPASGFNCCLVETCR